MNTPIKLTLNLSQIAELAKVSLSAVSQWRKRYDDFPKSLGESSLGASFSYEEVRDWLIRNDKLVDEASPEKILYYCLDSLRAWWAVSESTNYIVSCLVLFKAAKTSDSSVSGVFSTLVENDTQFLSELSQLLERVNQKPGFADGMAFTCLRPNNTPPERVLHFVFRTIVEAANSGSSLLSMFEAITNWRSSVDRFEGQSPDSICELVRGIVPFSPSTVLDPAVGTGKLLHATIKKGQSQEFIGWDLNREALWYATCRFALSESNELVSFLNNSLTGLSVEPHKADLVVCEPPLGLRIQNELSTIESGFWPFGLPSPTSSDFAWLQLAWTQLKPNGHAVVLLGAASLWKEGRSSQIRSAMLDRGVVEAIVRLPQKMLVNTSVQTCLWVLGNPVPNTKNEVLLVDLVDKAVLGKAKNSIDGAWILEAGATIRRWLENKEVNAQTKIAKLFDSNQILEVGLEQAFNSINSPEAPTKAFLRQEAKRLTDTLSHSLDKVQKTIQELKQWEASNKNKRGGE